MLFKSKIFLASPTTTRKAKKNSSQVPSIVLPSDLRGVWEGAVSEVSLANLTECLRGSFL